MLSLLAGYIYSIFIMYYSEYFTSYFFKPVKALTKVAEDGEF